MSRKLSQEQINELDKLYKRFQIYKNYMLKFYDPSYQSGSIESMEMVSEVADEIYQKKQLTNMRRFIKEIDIEIREELGSQAIEVKRLFHEQLGEDIIVEEKKYHKKLDTIIKRGKVRTEAEYRLIDSHHQELFPEHGNTDEVMELDRLLGTFRVS